MTLAWLGAAGCGRSTTPPSSAPDATLTFHILDQDTAGLSRGPTLLTAFDIYRDATGAIRTRGRIHLPDGTRLQLTLYRPGRREILARTQFPVANGEFQSLPLTGPSGGFPEGRYRFELVSYFDSSWQPPQVMTATDDGRSLRGPGIVRGQNGIAAFVHTEDQRL